jgi:uncharacterized damage-inducible protein DinB
MLGGQGGIAKEAYMFSVAKDFLTFYEGESAATGKVLANLTDEALPREKAPGHNTVGDIAWQIACSPLYMLSQVGFDFDPKQAQKPEPLTVADIQAMHTRLVAEVKAQVASKTPEDLAKVYKVFGMMDWSAATMLTVLLHHEIHHRGQLTVLMRQAGLVVPSIYGPTYEMNVEEMRKQMAEQEAAGKA